MAASATSPARPPVEAKAASRVCVVGAGIAGLVTAKVLQEDGFDVVVFDKAPSIGGVWHPSRTYPGLRTNGPRETYAFSDFPYPDEAGAFPTAEQVLRYLESYADHFGLRDLVRASTEVVSISRNPEATARSRFEVVVEPTDGSGGREAIDFDFVAICNGVFSVPHVPELDGHDRFAGRVLHSSELTDSAIVEDERVIVVGAGKSALDCATLAARHGRSCTLVFRRPHWMVPRYFFGLLRMDRLLLTRFSELFLRYHRQSRVEAFLHGRARVLVRLFWRAQSWLVARLLRIPTELLPNQPLPTGFESIGVGGEFYEVLRQGRLVPKRARIESFTGADQVELDTGEHLEADVVVFATGWRQDVSFLEPELRSEVQKSGNFHLYRHILPPGEPHLGLVGYASSIASQFSSEVAAHWLSQCFRGELSLPSREEMEREIARVREWTSDVFPERQEGYFIGPYVAHYTDELVADMGLRTTRVRDPLRRYFGRYLPRRYRGLAEERRRARDPTLAGTRT